MLNIASEYYETTVYLSLREKNPWLAFESMFRLCGCGRPYLRPRCRGTVFAGGSRGGDNDISASLSRLFSSVFHCYVAADVIA